MPPDPQRNGFVTHSVIAELVREEATGAVAVDESGLPSVGVVIASRGQPGSLRQALISVLAQDYPGPLHVVVVHERTNPQPNLISSPERPVTVRVNTRTPGLAGSRNTGVLALSTDLVAFCDDTDEWRPNKLSTQVPALTAALDTELATCGLACRTGDNWAPRLAGRDRIDLSALARSRRVRFPSSTFLAYRRALTDPSRIGLLAEDAPGHRNEDWDLLLRAARRGALAHVDEPLVLMTPPRPSRYDYATDISSLRWLMARHPEIRGCRADAARLYGQLACWSAAIGNRRGAWHWTRQAVRQNWREPRAALALAAISGAVRVHSALAALNRRDPA
jgi:glycosyltransferase involved in cell wall biosynthesis